MPSERWFAHLGSQSTRNRFYRPNSAIASGESVQSDSQVTIMFTCTQASFAIYMWELSRPPNRQSGVVGHGLAPFIIDAEIL
jgi:hypothetical protein